MKDKKGFTLVELLAVIVILAIIALITTPIIMRVIKDARQKAALSSFRGYMDAVEKTIIRDSMKTTSELPSKDTNGCYNLKELDKFVKVKGTKPVIDDDDTLCISNGKIKSISEVIINGYKIQYEDNEIKINGGNTIEKNTVNLTINAKLGDLIKMTPTSTSYTISSSLTGANTHEINPSQMKWWRIINKKENGTMDVISEYVQNDITGKGIKFYGKEAYKNYIQTLNTIANQYVNNKYTQSARYFGYNNQTQKITSEINTANAGTTGTPLPYTITDNGQEYNGGVAGDTLFFKDYNDLKTAVAQSNKTGSDCNKLDTNGTPTNINTTYWVASRTYFYINSNDFHWDARYATYYIPFGNLGYDPLYYYYRNDGGWFDSMSEEHGLRIVLTLKANLDAVESSEENVDWILE